MNSSTRRVVFKFYDLTSISRYGYYVVCARVSKSLNKGKYRDYARGFWEIVPKGRFANVKDLKDWVMANNPDSRFNNVTSNNNVGVWITQDCIWNNVTNNNFLNNNLGGTSQALDNSGENNFWYNYWTDATGSDADSDGYLDNPYSIDGNPGNEDQLPSATIFAYEEPCPTSSSPVWSSPPTPTPGWSLMLVFVAMLPLLSLRRKK